MPWPKLPGPPSSVAVPLPGLLGPGVALLSRAPVPLLLSELAALASRGGGVDVRQPTLSEAESATMSAKLVLVIGGRVATRMPTRSLPQRIFGEQPVE